MRIESSIYLKFIKYSLYYLLFFTLFFACSKGSGTVAEIDKLPPETQTGERTFGCLVNGKAFLPKQVPFSYPALVASYQYLNGEYFLNISASDFDSEPNKGIIMGSHKLKILQGVRYRFDSTFVSSTVSAEYSEYFKNPFRQFYYVTNGGAFTGELYVKRFDTTKNIISGTFWYDAKTDDGKTVQIREGRFDMPFTR